MRPVCAVGAVRPVCAAAISISESKLTQLVRGVDDASAVCRNLARRAAEAGGDVHDGVVGEKVTRPQEQREGLDGHDGEILGRRDVGYSEGVP